MGHQHATPVFTLKIPSSLVRTQEQEVDMQSDSAARGNHHLPSAAASDSRGKHRISAELKRLEQETKFLEEELEQLEKVEAASAVCKEIIGVVETKPDALLPVTNGPTDPSWDRWFEGPKHSQGCRCYIL